MTLTDMAKKYLPASATMGPVGLDREDLRRDLARVSKGELSRFYIVLALCVLLFCLQFFLILEHRNDTTPLKPVAGSIGITVFGLLCYIAKLNRDHGKTLLIVTMLPYLSEPDLRKVLESLLARRNKRSSAAQPS